MPPKSQRRSRSQLAGQQEQHDHTTQQTAPPNTASSEAAQLRATVSTLPVHLVRKSIVDMIRRNRAVVIVGETGSGKTTAIPQFILDDIVRTTSTSTATSNASNTQHQQMVGITQPRRVAATSVAEFVARCRGVECGGEVGYCVRFDEKTSASTRLKFMTDGMLLRELLVDPNLSRYACIVLDEAHERTLNGDVLFGLLKQLYRRRKDLRIVVMSATLDSDAFSKFWDNCEVAFVRGRAFEVKTFYMTEPQADYVDASIITILQIHLTEPGDSGDVLCFLTGQEEIEDARRVLEERRKFLPPGVADYKVISLYAAMSPAQQREAFLPAPPGCRKIILATNIAETSITIDGIVYVVDCGFVKSRQFHPTSGLETLQVIPGSKAQARQRCGRAGRTRPGKCYRIFTEDAFYTKLPEQTVPEILRCNLSSVVLQMKAMGIDDVLGFEFMDRPSEALLLRSMEELMVLGALNEETGAITSVGRDLVQFPVEPMEAKAILKAMELGCSDEVCVILAMMSVSESGLFEGGGLSIGGKVLDSGSKQQYRAAADANRHCFAKALGDHLTLLAVYESWSNHLAQHGGSGGAAAAWCQTNGVNLKQMRKAVEVEVQLRTHCARIQANLVTRRQHSQQTQQPQQPQQQHVGINFSLGGSGGGVKIKNVPPFNAAASTQLRSEAAAEYPSIRRALTAGFFTHTAYYDVKSKNYRTAMGKDIVHIHPTSVMFNLKKKPPLVLFHVVVHTSKQYMREVLAIREEWLIEEAPMVFARNTSSSAS